MKAARGRAFKHTEPIKGSKAKRILLKTKKTADTIMKIMGWEPGTPIGKRGIGITTPIGIGEAPSNQTLKNITLSTIGKARRKDSTRTKIHFVPDWAHKTQGENNAGKYITIAIEDEEKATIGIMREYDTNTRPQIQLTIDSVLKGFPIGIRTGKTISIKANRESIRAVAEWKGEIMGRT